jgi:hypothetical protein
LRLFGVHEFVSHYQDVYSVIKASIDSASLIAGVGAYIIDDALHLETLALECPSYEHQFLLFGASSYSW